MKVDIEKVIDWLLENTSMVTEQLTENYSGNYIEFDQYKSKHHTLAFPTEEMGDAFKENFDPDIEI